MSHTAFYTANTGPKASEANGLHHYHTDQHLSDSLAQLISTAMTFWHLILWLLPFSKDA